MSEVDVIQVGDTGEVISVQLSGSVAVTGVQIPAPIGGISAGEAQDLIDNSLGDHIVAPLPHPAYDDIPSLTLLFENRLV